MTFMQWLATFPLERIAIYTVVGLIGMLSHAVKKFSRGELSGSVVDYFLREHTWRSLAAVGSWLSVVLGTAMSGMLTDLAWGALVLQAWGLGVGCDSFVNKAQSPGAQDQSKPA